VETFGNVKTVTVFNALRRVPRIGASKTYTAKTTAGRMENKIFSEGKKDLFNLSLTGTVFLRKGGNLHL